MLSRSNLNWNDLRVFLTLVRCGNHVAAARILGVDHTTVRRRIAGLEEILKAQLIERGREGTVLTQQGSDLFHAAEAMENMATQAEEQISGKDLQLSGTIRIGAADGLGSYFLAPLLVRFQKLHPELKIELLAQSRQFNVAKRDVDMALVISWPETGRHMIRKLTDCKLRLYASRKYLSSHAPIITVQDLSEHVIIGYIDQLDYSPEIDPNNPAFSVLSVPTFTSSNMVAQAEAAIADGGISLLPRYMIRATDDLQAVLEDEVVVERSVWMITHADLRHLSRYERFVNFLVHEVQSNQHLFM
jgi:DNA-binding transcriptional LysR family regulator